MRILDRYVLKSVFQLFLGCILVFLFLYVIIDVFSHLEDILKASVSISTLLRYYLAYLPIIFVQVAPTACLLSTLYVLGKLNHANEIIAMRSSGLSVLRIIRPVIIFGVLVSAFIFWIGDRFVPPSLALTEKIKGQMESGGKKSQEKEVIENLSMYGMKNRLFFINKFFPATSTMEGIVILEHDEHQDITKKIVANKGAYTNGMWKFYHSITYELDANGQVKKEPQFFQEELMNIPESPVEFLTQRQRPDFMTIAQLDNYIWKLSKSGAAPVVRNFRIDLYQRFTTPLMSVLVMLLAVPFSLAMHKRATGMSSIGISIMVGFLYYVVNAIAVNLGKAGILTPVLAVTFSHISVLLTALYLIGKLP